MNSATFARSARARSLLQHLIDVKLSGDLNRLKGSVLAIEVFGKNVGADAAADSVVRVQIGRLREMLERYYEQEGGEDAVRFSIPLGSYVPDICISADANVFGLPPCPASRPAEAAAPMEPPAASPMASDADAPLTRALDGGDRRSGSIDRRLGFPDRRKGPRDRRAPVPDRRRRPSALLWAAVGAFVALALFPYVFDAERFALSAPSASEVTYTGSIPGDGSMALPALFVTADASDPEVREVAAILKRALPGFDVIHFYADAELARRNGNGARNVFRLHVADAAKLKAVEISLFDDNTGRVLQTDLVNQAQMTQPSLNDRLASILTSMVSISGAIYANSEEANTQSPLMHCLLRYDRFRRSGKPGDLDTAYRCYDALVAEGRKSAIIYSQMAALEADAFIDQHAIPPRASLEHALGMANKAIELGPTSAYAHREVAYVNARLGKPDEALRWSRKAYELNTFNFNMVGAAGCISLYAERYGAAAELSAKAIAGMSSYPDRWDFCSFAANFMLGRTDEAQRAADAIDLNDEPQFMVARIIGADLGGRRKYADETIAMLTDEHPDFAAAPREALRRLKLPDPLIDKMLSALQAAGFANGS